MVLAPATRFRLTCLYLTLLTLLTFYQRLDLTHPQNDVIKQTITTPNFHYRTTTQRNRHANRCLLIRPGDPTTLRTSHKTTCDILYLDPVKSLTNVSRAFIAADYVSSQWEAVKRTYNDGIMYVSNDAFVTSMPLGHNKVHIGVWNHTSANEWFSVAPFKGVQGTLQRWIRKARVDDCSGGMVECHTSVGGYSCKGAMDAIGCRRRDWGAVLVRALLMTSALFLAGWRVYGLGVVMFGRSFSVPRVSGVLAACVVGAVAFAGMDIEGMAWLLSRIVGVRYGVLHEKIAFVEGDVYRVGGLRGRYEGYAYLWSDGDSVVRVTGPGVGLVVVGVAIGLFFKRALLDGLLVRVIAGVVGVFCACQGVELVLKKRGRRVVVEEADYLSGDIRKTFVKQGRSRVFFRERERRK